LPKSKIPTITWTNGNVKIIDQTLLPNKYKYITCKDVDTLVAAIKRLSVRGAPALGAAAAFGVLLGCKTFKGKIRKEFDAHIKSVCHEIGKSRPTAVNLFNSLTRMLDLLYEYPLASVSEMKFVIKKEAMRIFNHDKNVCRLMGKHGAALIKNNANVMTICNAGALATVDYGTALGVFYSANAKKKKFKVFACETRPLLQGARLTSWELLRDGIDTTLICDNMAASLMKNQKIDGIFVGADRIAANGDTANKIGTYNLAILAKYHRVPFYVVAPLSTFDLWLKNGSTIPIEKRAPEEVTSFGQRPTAPKDVKVYNPAFDVTDKKLITAIITEVGIIRPPFKKNIKRVFSSNKAKSVKKRN